MMTIMPTALSSLFDITNSTVASGFLVAFAGICLVQYGYWLLRQKQFQAEVDKIRREAEDLESELSTVNRDQSITKLENQILRDILNQTDFSRALDQLLRRFVPVPANGFAAFVELHPDKSLLRQSRGLSENSCRDFRVDDNLIQSLRSQPTLVLDHLALQRSRLFASLHPADRKKIREVVLVGIGEGSDLFSILVTTSLLPHAAPQLQQLELTHRLMSTMSGNLRQTIMLEKQRNQLQSTREMLELRSIIDGKFDQPNQMLEKFITRLAQLVSGERGVLFLSTREAGNGLKVAFRSGVQLPAGVSTAWQQHEEQLAEIGLAYPKITFFDLNRLQKVQIQTLVGSAVTLPIVQSQTTIGLLCLTRRTTNEFTTAEKELLDWAGETLSQAMQRTMAYAAIERQAKSDGLTELANRRSFDQQIQSEVELVRTGSQVESSLLLMDLDRFKSINDRYGHQAGDEVLKSTAQILRDQMSRIRNGDRVMLARYGGEELAALLPGIGVAGALRIAESIRRAIEESPVVFHGETIQATISIGVATCPLHAKTTEEMIAAADMSLYQAKSQGRNRVCCPGETISPEPSLPSSMTSVIA